jgi:hypothetical protein
MSLKRPSQDRPDPVAIGSSPRTIDIIQGPKKKAARKKRVAQKPSDSPYLNDEVVFLEANEYNKEKKAFVIPAMEAGIINTLINHQPRKPRKCL